MREPLRALVASSLLFAASGFAFAKDEVFSPDGLLSAAFCRAFPDAAKKTVSVTTKGPVRALSCTVHPLRSIWR